ncbi:hypothetical protein ACOSQ2_005847 [Xanthoceras sorbifolium]
MKMPRNRDDRGQNQQHNNSPEQTRSPPTKRRDGRELLGRNSGAPKLPRFLLTDESRREDMESQGRSDHDLPPRRRKAAFTHCFFREKTRGKGTRTIRSSRFSIIGK